MARLQPGGHPRQGSESSLAGAHEPVSSAALSPNAAPNGVSPPGAPSERTGRLCHEPEGFAEKPARAAGGRHLYVGRHREGMYAGTAEKRRPERPGIHLGKSGLSVAGRTSGVQSSRVLSLACPLCCKL